MISARERPRRRGFTLIEVLVALVIVTSASAYGYVQWRLGQIHRIKIAGLTITGPGANTPDASTQHSSGGPPFTVLIVGSDSRAALSDGSNFGGASTVQGQRSDTIILARVVPATRQVMLLSIPRDLWVNIPGMGQNRINSAFDSGASLLVQTIETDLGIPVNHYVEINFDTFRDISNAVGGVGFYFPTPARDAYSMLNIPTAGCYVLQGDTALEFVRSRHYQYYENGYWQDEALSDIARIQRQQAFIKKLLKRAEGEFTNPIALNNVIAGVTKNLTVDSGFSNSLILELARDFRSIDASTIPTATLPIYPFTTSGGAAVLGLQQPQANQTIDAFKAFGTTAQAPPSTTTTAPASTTTPPTSPQSAVAPSSVSVEVVNGSGVSGQAAQMTQTLSSLGYTHVSVGASPGYGHQTTEVLYAPDSLAAAQQLAAQIPGGATLVASSALAPSPYNLEVVTGTSYQPGAATGGASSTTAPTTTTTVPGTNPSNYILPGLAQGAAVPNCPN